MNKLEKLRQLKIGNYFRELPVVIIGVAVTLYAIDAITKIKEKVNICETNIFYVGLNH
jgi:hypothetical protein